MKLKTNEKIFLYIRILQSLEYDENKQNAQRFKIMKLGGKDITTTLNNYIKNKYSLVTISF